jgi:hypothetical protein
MIFYSSPSIIMDMKAQASIEFLMVVGLAIVISAPFILQSQTSLINTSEGTDIARFQSSLDNFVQKIQRVDVMGSPASDSIRLDIPEGITDARVVNSERENESTAIVFTRNRSGELNNYTRFVNAELPETTLPTEQGSRRINIEAHDNMVNLTYDTFKADFRALNPIVQNSEVNFEDRSQTLGNIISNYTWIVNNTVEKTGSSEDTFSYQVNQDSDINVTLKIEDSEGETDQASKIYSPETSQLQIFSLNTQQDWNRGVFEGTSVDRNDNSGNLGLGYLNGTNPSSKDLEEGLIGYWRMDRNIAGSGGNVIDYSGNQNNGTTDGGVDTGADGVLGTNSFDFTEDDDDYINYGERFQFNDSEEFTISFWIDTTKVDQNDRPLGFDTTSGWGFLYLGFETGNDELGFRGDGNVYLGKNEGVAEVEDGWTHVAVTHNGSGGLKMFENALKIDSVDSASWTTPSDSFFLGDSGQGSSPRWEGRPDNFDGLLDEARIYNRELSNKEINRLYFKRNPLRGKYTSKIIENNEEQNWDELQVQASIPNSTELTATFQTLKDSYKYTLEEIQDSVSDWKEGEFNKTTSENILVDNETINLNTEDFNATTSDEIVTEYNYSSEFELSNQSLFNTGDFNGTSADRKDNSGDLGLGYLNGTNPSSANLEEGLVGYWRFDSGIAEDYSGYNNDGNLRGDPNTQVSGILGTDSLQFDGNNDYVEIPDSASLDITQGVTMSMWVKGQPSGNYVRLLEKGENSAYELFGADSNEFRPWMRINGNGLHRGDIGPLDGSNWKMLTATYNSSTGQSKIYVNGSSVSSDSLSQNIDTNSDTLRIATEESLGGSDKWDGKIDEVRVYNRSLSESEVEELYFQGVDGKFEGSYVAERIDNGEGTEWNSLEVDASVPSDTSVNATFKALNNNENAVDSQTLTLNEGLQNYSLSVSSSVAAEVVINGSSSNVTKSWEVHGLEVFSSEVVDKNEGLRIGYRNGSSDDDLVGYWRFDRNVSGSGGAVKDYSGNKNRGAAQGGLTTERLGILSAGAFEFDGSSDYVDIGRHDISRDFALSVWAKPDEKAFNQLVSGGPVSDGSSGSYSDGFYFVIDNRDSNRHLFLNMGGEYTQPSSNSLPVETVSNWGHILISCDYNSNQCEFYYDGEIVGSDDYPVNPGSLDLGEGAIGARLYNGPAYFDGSIDEVRVYNRSLSESEVEDLYFQGMDGKFDGSYVAERIDNGEGTEWNSLEVNASVPSDTGVNATFKALDSEGNVVDSQRIELKDGFKEYDLEIDDSQKVEVLVNGTTEDIGKTWRIHNLEVKEQVKGVRIGYRDGSPGDDLVGYWRMDRKINGDGGIVRDYSGEGNEGIAEGNLSSGIEGVLGSNAFEFDGSDDFVTNDKDSGVYDFNDPASYSFWAKTSDSSGSYFGILGSHQSSNPYNGWAIANDNGQVSLWTDQSSWQSTGVNIADGNWHHYTAVIDGSEFKLYKDGVLERTLSYTPPSSEDVPFYIADRNDAEGNPFEGSLDEIRIYNRTLSESEIKNLYFVGKPFQSNFTSKTINKKQQTSWDNVEIEAEVPSDTNLGVRFEALGSNGETVDTHEFSVHDGLSNYTIDVNDSTSARLKFDGASSNTSQTWVLNSFELYSGERRIDQSQSFEVQDGSNKFPLNLNSSNDARVELNGSTSKLTKSWVVDSLSVMGD